MENAVKSFEPSIDHFIRINGSGIEIFGVLVIVIGIVWSTYRQLRQPISEQDADVYKIRIGRSLLLGLEVLVAADIVKTIAHELSVMSLGLLAGLVLVVPSSAGRWYWKSKAGGRGSGSPPSCHRVLGREEMASIKIMARRRGRAQCGSNSATVRRRATKQLPVTLSRAGKIPAAKRGSVNEGA